MLQAPPTWNRRLYRLTLPLELNQRPYYHLHVQACHRKGTGTTLSRSVAIPARRDSGHHNSERILQLILGTRDVREDPAFGRLCDKLVIVRLKERDHRAGRPADDLADQLERVI
jgi:hypothetical protein